MTYPDLQGWRIWYADGTTYDSSEGAFTDAPSTGVQVVITFYTAEFQTGPAVDPDPAPTRPLRSVYTGADYYWRDSTGGHFGSCNDIADVPEGSDYVEGSMMEDLSAFQAIDITAHDTERHDGS